MSYVVLKQLHMGLAFISIGGFILRWCWRMQESRFSAIKTVRILPHVVDTLFLGSAIAMTLMLGQIPVSDVWLTSKITGLVIYILLGMVAMRTAPVIKHSLPAFLAAVLIFAWVVSVARLKDPSGFLGQLGCRRSTCIVLGAGGQAPFRKTINGILHDVSTIDLVLVYPEWGTGDGAVYRLDNVKILGNVSRFAPVIDSSPLLSITQNNLYSYSFIASDADNNSLSLSAPQKPGWLDFDSETGIHSGLRKLS